MGIVTQGWYQGDQTIFSAHSGAFPESYIASNYNVAEEHGQMANWLITPTFSTVTAGTVTFWIRGDDFPGFEDQVAFGFSNGSDATADFTLLGSQVVAVGVWNQITVPFSAGAPGSIGRFAIEHVGPQDSANYIGVDTLSIDTAAGTVPVPAPIAGAGTRSDPRKRWIARLVATATEIKASCTRRLSAEYSRHLAAASRCTGSAAGFILVLLKFLEV